MVAMVHEICPICGKKMNESLLIHQRFGDLSEVHGKATGISSKPCEECQAGLDKGAIMLIVLDKEKSGDTPETWYRTGNIFGMSEDWANRVLNEPFLSDVLKRRVATIDYKDVIAIGLPVNYNP